MKIVSVLAGLGADVDVENEFGNTPLMEAALVGNLSMVLCLLEHGANIAYQSSKHGSTALHFALEYRKPDVANVLLQHRAPLNLPDLSGETALELIYTNEYEYLLRDVVEQLVIRHVELKDWTSSLLARSAMLMVQRVKATLPAQKEALAAAETPPARESPPRD